MNIYAFTPKKREPNFAITLTSSKIRGGSKPVKFNIEACSLTDASPPYAFQIISNADGFTLSVHALVMSSGPGMQIEVHPEAVTEFMCALAKNWDLDMGAAFDEDDEDEDEDEDEEDKGNNA